MEDNNRINRRSRPRPYDLRRKVLLKNFLREQMTHIPFTESQTDSASQNDSVFVEESTVSIHLDEDLPELNEDLLSLPTVSVNPQSDPNLCDNADPNPIVTDSKEDDVSFNIDNSINANSSCDSAGESSLFKFASLVKFKKESKKTLKSISKAKDVCKSVRSSMKTRSFKSGIERVFYGRKRPESSSSHQMPKNSSRSLFSLFKHRREQRNLKEVPRFKRSTCINLKTANMTSKYRTINQSVQTDDSWSKDEMIRVQKSNMRLKEENRLLSESLSYFMSNTSMDPQIRHFNSPLQSSNKNLNNTIFPDYYVPSSNSTSDSWNPRSRVTRSKSMQEYNERRNMSRNNYRTRSMSYHNSYSYQNNFLSTDIKPPFSARAHGAQSQVINIPRVRRKNTLNLPVSSTVRGIQRRSSMPERILSENDRSMVCRHSGSFRDTYSRKPFNFLPSEAFY